MNRADPCGWSWKGRGRLRLPRTATAGDGLGRRESSRSGRGRRLGPLALGAVVAASGALSSTAQDAELAPLRFLLERSTRLESAEVKSIQIYQIPLSYTVREPAGGSAGVRLTFPVTLGTHELAAATDVADFVARVNSASITPGIELQFSAGRNWLVKPFGEIGLGAASGGSGETSEYAFGLRTLGRYAAGSWRIAVGGSARYASPRSRRDLIQDYTTVELGIDAQLPLGVGLGARRVRGGGYAIVRFFPDLDLPETVAFDVGRSYEMGLSLAASPELAALTIKLPWIGFGYRFGDLFTGLRISFGFPF